MIGLREQPVNNHSSFLVFATLTIFCFLNSQTLGQQRPNDRPQNAASPQIVLQQPPNGAGPAWIEVVNLGRQTQVALAAIDSDDKLLGKVLAVFVADEEDVPVLGSWRVEEGRLVFKPRFPFRENLEYRGVFDPSAIPGIPTASGQHQAISRTFRIGSPTSDAPASYVEAVYPSGDELPENLLRFYIHFSAPMSRRNNYRHIRLLDADGEPIPYPFLELGEELWDPEQRRFTLLFDPGRVKRELHPNQEVGSPLIEGRRYTLEINSKWRDAKGQPMREMFQKSFRVVAPDVSQPDPRKWRISAPPAGGRKPLVVDLAEPLDHGMLHRSLGVADSDGNHVAGAIRLSSGERKWEYQPQDVWKAGEYELLVDVNLEDRAGNSIERPFEVDVLRPVQLEITTELQRIPFAVKGRSPAAGN